VNRRWPAAIAAAAVAWYAADSLHHRREEAEGYQLRGEVDVGSESFLRTAESLTGAPITRGNTIELLINGDRIFPALLETIAGAERSINLLTYVYWTGDIAGEVADALCARARAGVEVNVILDAVGAARMDSRLVERMEGCGVSVVRFRPPRPYALRRINNRTHRKVCVVDGRIGMTGGVGIAEEWTGDAQDPDHWRDTHVRVRGPVVRGLQGAFAENWLEATGDVLAGDEYLPDLEATGDRSAMQVIRSAAGVGDTNAETLYFLAIAAARRSIELTAAYFAPRPAFVDTLVKASRAGVDVRIVVPGPHSHHQLVRVAGRATYDALLRGGVRIWEYQPTMLHAKTMVVDGAWSAVGSVNFDNRSFQLNDEATLTVQSEEFAGELARSFAADLEQSVEMRPGRFARRPLRARAAENAARLARREL
jgi:cardiolipin synthase